MITVSGTVFKISMKTVKSSNGGWLLLHGGYAEKQRRSDTCCLRLLLVGQTDFGSRSLNGLGDTGNIQTDGEITAISQRHNGTEYSRDFHFNSGLTGLDLEVSLPVKYIPLNISM